MKTRSMSSLVRSLMAVLWGCATLCSSAAPASPQPSPWQVSAGRLERFEIDAPQLERNVTIDVLLPEGYGREAGRRHPVVYMHDGQNLFDATQVWNGTAWEIDEAVARLQREAPQAVAPIVVGVHSNAGMERVRELMPAQPLARIASPAVKAQLEQYLPGGAQGDLYVDFLASTLKPAVDSLYATLPDAANTSVMGSSMGGLASMNALCLRPDVFGSAACLSTHWIGTTEANELFPAAFEAFLLESLPVDGGAHRIYFDTGTDTLDALYGPYHERIAQLAQSLGMTPGLDLLTAVYPGQGHTESAWASRVDTPLRFVLRLPAGQ